ncbi:D-aminoacylase [Penicillium cosmopolitanum]|uniref:D-aminoacylase n=1 Tax=Penicillium cosmopolitanum TaxID=1131564 RepID=A0A9W9W1I5_9EURO|nr:D-aminoacylase [Penicillium cosmopolitanum]KAJ5396787.1 D-aminoacylase [Penicillium cosmopolitanum]
MRLQASIPIIEEIRSITGNAGLSIGVLHKGEVIFRENLGYRDVENKVAPDSDTIFPIASLTKALVAAAFAELVDDGKLTWETKLSDLVPEYKSLTDDIKLPQLVTEANIVDLLAHRLGLTAGNNFWSQKQQIVLADKTETARILGSLQPVAEFRSKMVYSNWGYGLAGEILEDISNQGLGTCLKTKLFEPLNMARTKLGHLDDSNSAKSYMALGDATPFLVPPTAYVEGTARAGAGACKSTVNDLLVLYNSWMGAAAEQQESGNTFSPESPIRRASELWTSHASMTNDTSYGLGWVLTELPGQGGLVGVNGYEADSMPIIAKGTTKQRMVYHQGSVCGALSAVYLLPDTRTAVIVLGNSFDLCDTPDWASQVLLEAILAPTEPNDYIELARKTSANALSHHEPTATQLREEKESGTTPKSLDQYEGRYYNKIGNFFLDISIDGEGLRMAPQGYDAASYSLHHYHNDVFAWDCNRDAESKEALYPQFAIGFHRVRFEADESGNVVQFNWQIDKAIAEGETFFKKAEPKL